ncbi:50S ribosomal protein L22 [Patescibacteria group bacterium]|nr:50S ribosomal protein L22 [Patescibacteria group bacterium]
MKITANANGIRISPRKVRLVADLVRGLKTDAALNQLNYCGKKAGRPIFKLISSAIANATHNYNLDENNLIINEIRVDKGNTIKRWMPRAHGRATPIRKMMSNISLVLQEIKDSGNVLSIKHKIDEPIRLGEAPKEDKVVKKDDKTKKISKGTNKEAKVEPVVDKIVDTKSEGRGGHTKIEGGGVKGFTSKIFRRKSG